MANDGNLGIHDVANLHGVAWSRFALDNLGAVGEGLANKPKAGAGDPLARFRDMFASISKTGSVAHEKSILSPACYFVDLMRLVQQKTVTGNGKPLNPESPMNLFVRRPDLLTIPLDADNTLIEEPLLDMVNTALLGHIAALNRAQAPAPAPEDKTKDTPAAVAPGISVAEARYPISLPWHAPLESTRAYLGRTGTDLETVYRLFDAPVTAQTAETLGLSAQEFATIADPDVSPGMVQTLFDLPSAKSAASLYSFDSLLPRLNLTPEQMRELLFEGREYARIYENGPLRSPLFLNNALAAAVEANTTDSGYNKNTQYLLIPSADRWSIEEFYDSFFDSPTQEGGEAIREDHGLWEKYEIGHGGELGLKSSAYLTLCQNAALCLMNRFIRLSRALGWSFADLGWALTQCGADKLDAEALKKLAQVKTLQKQLDLPLDQVVCFCGMIHATATSSETPGLFQRAFGFDWATEATLENIAARHFHIFQNAVPSWLGAGLRLSASDLGLLIGYIRRHEVLPEEKCTFVVDGKQVTQADTITLKFASVGILYRYALLSQILKRSMAETLGLLDELDIRMSGLDDLRPVLKYSAWLREVNVGVAAMQMVVQNELPADKAQTIAEAATTAVLTAQLQTTDHGHVLHRSSEEEGLSRRQEIVLQALAAHFSVETALLWAALKHAVEVVDGMDVGSTFLEAVAGASLDEKRSVIGLSATAVSCFGELALAITAFQTFQLTEVDLEFSDKADLVIGTRYDMRRFRSLKNLNAMDEFGKLRKKYPDIHAELLDLIRKIAASDDDESGVASAKANAAELGDKLNAHHGWNAADVARLVLNDKSAGQESDDNPLDQANAVAIMSRIVARHDLATATGCGMPVLLQMVDLAEEPVTPLNAARWTAYERLASDTRHALQSRSSPDDWTKLDSAIRGDLAERQRDALISYVLWLYGKPKVPASLIPFGSVTTRDDLSNILLIDVQMGGTSKISRIKQGLNTLQRYIQRCHMGLEKNKSVQVHIPLGDAEWSWRMHYRMWEANRKIFLFPENYLEPGARQHKTPLFKELEQEVLQGAITEESVAQAYLSYFEKLEMLSNLDVVSSCQAMVKDPGGAGVQETVFLVGRDKHEPRTFFKCSAIVGSSGDIERWHPWQKISLPLHVDHVICAWLNTRLHLFWVEQTTSTDRGPDGRRHMHSRATVLFSHETVSGRWMPPQTLPQMNRILVASGYEVTAPEKEKEKTKPKPEMISDCFFRSSAVQFPPGKPVVNLVLSVTPGDDPAVPVARLDLNARPTGSYKPDRTGRVNAFALNSAIQPWSLTSANHRNYMDGFAPAEDMPTKSGGAAIENPEGISIAPDGRTLLLGTGLKGPYRSEDGGKTWQQITGPGGIRLLKYIGPLGRKMLFLGGKHIYSSADNGRSMQIEDDAWPSQGKQLASSMDGRVYLKNQSGTADNTSVWRYERGVHGWQKQKVIADWGEVSVSEDGQTLFAVTNGKIKRSADKGTTWLDCADTLAGWRAKSIFHCRNGIVIASAIMEDQSGGETETSWNMSIFRSEDNGQTWVQYNFGSQKVLFSACFAENADGVVFMCYPDGYTYFSQDFGYNWTRIQSDWSTKTDAITIGPDGLTMYLYSESYYGHTRPTYYAVVRPKTRNAIAHEWDGVTHSALPYLWQRNGTRHHYDLSSVAVHTLREKLSQDGLDAMLSLSTQRTTQERRIDGKLRTIEFGMHSMFAAYFREIFLHIPFLVANSLNSHQQHEQAQKWYHHVFRPLSTNAMIGEQGSDTGYWRFKPFADCTPESLIVDLKTHPQELALFASDPFDPYVIADLRLGAYEKAIAMKYIDNLLDWGDRLFTEYTWESIVQAMVLYKRAQDLLGPQKQDSRTPFEPPEVLNFETMIQADSSTLALKDPFHLADCNYFPIPKNDLFHGYWDRSEDRLHKIRLGLNIDGVHQDLALFQPPVDISALLQAKGAGQGIAAAMQSGAGNVPPYRFGTAMRLAKEVTGTVIQFGNAFLSALEAKDAKKLSALRVTQEGVTLDMMTRALEKEVELATATLTGLKEGKKATEKRVTTLSKRLDAGLSSTEQKAIDLRIGTLAASTMAMVYNEASVPLHLIPTVYGFADGSFQPGSAVQAHATGMSELSGLIEQGIQMTSERAGHERREQEWKIQLELSKSELTQVTHQIASATLQIEVAKARLARHSKSIAQAQEVADLLEQRFTDEALFQWLTGQLATVYFQCFQLALSWGRAAEQAYQYECNIAHGARIHSSWSDLQRGLMAGENLMLGLVQLEKSFHDDRPNELHIEKTVSLRTKDAKFIEAAKADNCTFAFDLTEADFARDFPGHYCRRIKSVAVTIPAVVGPYQNIHATLTQTGHRLVPSVDEAGQAIARTLLTGDSGADIAKFNSGSVPKSVAISRGATDSGVFDIEFHSDNYHPFERTGAVSSWELALPEFSNKDVIASLTDIIVHIRYTALDGGQTFAGEVMKQLKATEGPPPGQSQ